MGQGYVEIGNLWRILLGSRIIANVLPRVPERAAGQQPVPSPTPHREPVTCRLEAAHHKDNAAAEYFIHMLQAS